jgi:hypothetical protein
MNNPLINTLITGRDNIEVVRDQIAAILSLELRNQKRLADEAGVPDAGQYDVSVYVENARPYETGDRKRPLRLVNVILPSANLVSGARSGVQKEQAVFWIDCAATGNDAASAWNEKSASCRAWAVCRLARDILMSDAYLYLGLRGIAGSRAVTAMEAGSPQQGAGEAVQFAVVRLTLEVQFAERYIGQDGPEIEGIDFDVFPESGELVAGLGNGE